MVYCSDIMTRNVVTCTPHNTVTQTAQLMHRHDVGSIPVVENGNTLVGILTDRDITTRVVASGFDPKAIHVSTVMTDHPVTCRPDDDLETARSRMSEHQIRRLPIIGPDGYLVGIITQADLLLRSNADTETEKVLEEISKPSA